jgi:hypothetical protein
MERWRRKLIDGLSAHAAQIVGSERTERDSDKVRRVLHRYPGHRSQDVRRHRTYGTTIFGNRRSIGVNSRGSPV